MIGTIRKYLQYNMLNSCTCEVTQEFTFKITDHPPIIFIPINGYKGDLKVTDSTGNEMVILSDLEFEKEYKVPISKINEGYLSKLHEGVPVMASEHPTKHLTITKDHRLIAVVLTKKEDEYYEKIKLTWVERMETRSRKRISEFVRIPVGIHRYGFGDDKSSAVYLSIKIADKYEIMEKPKFTDFLNKKEVEVREILDDPIHQIFRFAEHDKPLFIQGEIKIGVPQRLIRWMQAGIVSSMFMCGIIGGLLLMTHRVPPFAFESLGGVIGFLIGERIIILQDLSLMKLWNSIHIFAAGGCVALIVGLIILVTNGSLPDPQYIIQMANQTK